MSIKAEIRIKFLVGAIFGYSSMEHSHCLNALILNWSCNPFNKMKRTFMNTWNSSVSLSFNWLSRQLGNNFFPLSFLFCLFAEQISLSRSNSPLHWLFFGDKGLSMKLFSEQLIVSRHWFIHLIKLTCGINVFLFLFSMWRAREEK